MPHHRPLQKKVRGHGRDFQDGDSGDTVVVSIVKIETLAGVLAQYPQFRTEANTRFRSYKVVGVELVDHGSHAYAYVEVKPHRVGDWTLAGPLAAKLKAIADTHPGVDVMAYNSDEAPYGGGEFEISEAYKNGAHMSLRIQAIHYGP